MEVIVVYILFTSCTFLSWLQILNVPLQLTNHYILGGSIFIHTLGAFFGLAVSLCDRKRDYNAEASSARQNTNHISDDFSLLGTLMLWIYWPSFNSVLATNLSSRNRASLNTYISMTASTVTSFLLSAMLGE